MHIRYKENPKTIARYDNSVILNWENVFICNSSEFVHSKIFTLQIYDVLSQWNTVYSGSRTQYECKQLAPNTPYKCQLKLIIIRGSKQIADNAEEVSQSLIVNQESEWVIFHTATSTDQFYLMHLTRAVSFEKTAMIRKIINHSPNLLDAVSGSFQQSQLYAAVHRSHLPMVQFLVNIGANINKPQPLTLRTPLMLAAFLGNSNITGIFIEKNSDYKMTDINKMNALHYAVDGGHKEIVEQILKLDNIDVNSSDNKGWTPLFRAVIMGANDGIILKLLQNGANRCLKDKNGHTLEDHCRMVDRSGLYNIIKDFSV